MTLGALKPEDVATLKSALGQQPTDKIVANMVAQKKLEQEHAAFVNDRLVKMALAGDYSANNGILASASLAKSVHPEKLAQFYKRMPLSEQAAFKDDFLAEILNTYTKGGEQSISAPYRVMPKGGKFLEDVGMAAGGAKPTEQGRQLLAKMDVVLGERERKKFVASMVMQDATSLATTAGGEMSVRAVVAPTNAAAYVAGNVSGAVTNRLMAIALGTKHAGLAVDLLAREIGTEAADKSFKNMVKGLFTTRTGLMAVSRNMGKDPQFDKEVTQMMKNIGEGKPLAEQQQK